MSIIPIATVMSLFTLLLWSPVLFVFMIAATYVGTKLALQSYFEKKNPTLSDFASIDEQRSE